MSRNFVDDSSLLSEGVRDQPSPGLLPEPLVAQPANEDTRPSDASSTTNRAAWLVLTAIAVVALTTAGGLRLREVLRNEDG